MLEKELETNNIKQLSIIMSRKRKGRRAKKVIDRFGVIKVERNGRLMSQAQDKAARAEQSRHDKARRVLPSDAFLE